MATVNDYVRFYGLLKELRLIIYGHLNILIKYYELNCANTITLLPIRENTR